MKIPGAGRLGFEYPAEPIGGLGKQNTVVQDAGRVENAPDRLILPGQVYKENFHCLAVGHVGLDILHFPVGTGVQRCFLPAPATCNHNQAGFSFEQPPRQEAADPSRAPRYEIGTSRTYDRIVLSQVHWNGRSVVHEDQFSHVARLCHVPESLLRMSHLVDLVRQGTYPSVRGHFDDRSQQVSRTGGPFLDELREIDGMIGPVVVKSVKV